MTSTRRRPCLLPLPTRLLPAVCALAALAAAPRAQQLTWAEGARADQLDVLHVAESTLGATPSVLLQGVEFLDLEISNRTLQRSQRGDVSRRVVRAGAPAFVELPGGGSLHHYRRDGGRRFGYLWIAADGTPTVVDERPGIGVGAAESPYTDRIGVAYDGVHAAIPLLAGDAVLARFDGGTFPGGAITRLAGIQDLVEATTVCPQDSVLICGSENDRVYRVAYAAGAPVEDLTPAPVGGDRLKGEFAPSYDGTQVVFLFGPQRLFSIFRLAETGPLVRLPLAAAKYEEPGYLPETANGPRLLLDDPGAQLFYVDSSIRDEAFAYDLGTTSSTAVTGDANFQPYIGVIILPYAMAGSFVAGIGDPGLFDVYETDSANPVVRNLTQTAGNTTRPWVSGGLVPRTLLATGDGRLLAEAQPSAGGPGELLRFDPQGARVLQAGTLGALARGSSFDRAGDLSLATSAGDRILADRDAAELLAIPAGLGVELSSTVLAPGAAYRVLLARETSTGRSVVAFRLGDGSLVGLDLGGTQDVAGVTSTGSLVLTGGARLDYFGLAGTLQRSATAVRALSPRQTAF